MRVGVWVAGLPETHETVGPAKGVGMLQKRIKDVETHWQGGTG